MNQGAARAQKILVVDDVETMRDMLKAWLEGLGYSVLIAEDGQQAVETAKRELPDLVLMDIGIGPQSGLTSVAQMREDAKLDGTPVVALTAYDSPGLRLDAEKKGFDEYVTKPFVPEELGQLIEKLLSKPRTHL